MWPHKITLSRGHANFWLGVTCGMSPSCQAWWPWALWKWRYIFNLSCDLTWPLVERAICYVMDGSLSWKITSLPGWWLLVMCKWRYIFLKFNFSCDFLKPCVWRIMQVCVGTPHCLFCGLRYCDDDYYFLCGMIDQWKVFKTFFQLVLLS